MGRELKRVPMDFDWPMKKTWEGYLNPFYKHSKDCPFCDRTGLNHETKAISDSMWCHNLEQEDVDALVKADRLWDFTRVPINEEQKKDVEDKIAKGENSWLPYDNGYRPTAAEVNEWSINGMGHDGLNHWVCTEAKTKRLGVYGKCKHCKGEGVIWETKALKKKYDEWESQDPPIGEGYQLWETTSEGSPTSPVFETLDKLCEWAEKNATVFAGYKVSKEYWKEMLDDGFVCHKEGNAIFI